MRTPSLTSETDMETLHDAALLHADEIAFTT